MRWCCTVFKTGAINKTLSQVFQDKTNVLTFYGIRKSESASRSKYDRESESPKITKQTVVSPIIDWIDFDVWLYILSAGIDFNDAYRLGYSVWDVGAAQTMVHGPNFYQRFICSTNMSIGETYWWTLQRKLESQIQKNI